MSKKFLSQIQSTVATGTAPLIVASTTAVTNLNADLLDGQHGSHYAPIASPTFTGTVTAPVFAATTNGTGLNFKVGDDAWIGDINIANAVSITGQQNSANGYIVFGNSNTTALGRAGTGDLTYGGNTIWHAGNQTTLFTSPALTGTPTAPTAAAGTNTTQIATTAFVTTAAGSASGTSLDPFLLAGL